MSSEIGRRRLLVSLVRPPPWRLESAPMSEKAAMALYSDRRQHTKCCRWTVHRHIDVWMLSRLWLKLSDARRSKPSVSCKTTPPGKLFFAMNMQRIFFVRATMSAPLCHALVSNEAATVQWVSSFLTAHQHNQAMQCQHWNWSVCSLFNCLMTSSTSYWWSWPWPFRVTWHGIYMCATSKKLNKWCKMAREKRRTKKHREHNINCWQYLCSDDLHQQLRSCEILLPHGPLHKEY